MVARLLVGLSIACCACGGEDYVVKVGLTGPESRFEVPPRARIGEAFPVSVTTYGGGCIKLYDTEVTLTTDDALVVPLDEYYVGGEHSCTADLRFYRHESSVMFDTAGPKTIRVRGRREVPITAGSRVL